LTSTGATSAAVVLDTVNGEGTIGLEGYVSGAEESYLTSVNTITGSPQVAIDNASFVGVGGNCVVSTP
jgi:16S rRNA G966 N2-methylase RsmD